MMKEFNIKDLERFEGKRMSGTRDMISILKDERWWHYSLENGVVKAIVSFIELYPGEWWTSALISKHFTARDSVELKAFLARVRNTLKPEKLYTISPPMPKVDRWHRFLGFAVEGMQEFQGKKYNRWVIA